MKPLIIFGAGQIAELAHFYFTQCANRKVVAFTVNQKFINENLFHNLPVVAFEDIFAKYSPENYDMFIAVSYKKMNKPREKIYTQAKEKGYRLASYISPDATVLCKRENIGDNCFILEDNTIQPFVTIGNNVTLWSGNHIGHHSLIKDHNFISSHVVISGNVTVGEHCFIGVNACINNEITIADESFIGPGAWISKNTNEKEVILAPKSRVASITSDKLAAMVSDPRASLLP